jgi:exonuclease VII small subunit
MGNERDKLQEIINELEDFTYRYDQAIDDLERVVESLSEVV